MRSMFKGPWVLDSGLVSKNAVFANPSIFVQLIELADKIITE
jgi:hypothetical protein